MALVAGYVSAWGPLKVSDFNVAGRDLDSMGKVQREEALGKAGHREFQEVSRDSELFYVVFAAETGDPRVMWQLSGPTRRSNLQM